MWGVAAYFNPANYATKLRNLELFSQRVRAQGLKLLIVELAFPDSGASPVPAEFADKILRLTSNCVLWQKERLLNLGIESLPQSCDKVVWLDADILFENNGWVEQTSHLLDQHKIVQPYQLAYWLPQGGEAQWQNDAAYLAKLHHLPGVGFAMRHSGEHAMNIVYRPDWVHPGFAWAARRSAIARHGLYDRFILGGGDFVGMLAMYSDARSLGNPNVAVCLSPHQFNHLAGWTNKFHTSIAGDVAYAPGAVFHLWHGNLPDRQYIERYEILREFDFDPETDIAADADGCWRWASDKPELQSQVKAYFSSRKEDGQ
jgi:hypothetical protein